MEKRSKAILSLLMSAVLWSSGGLFIKMVSWHPVAIAGLRSFIAMMVIVAYVRHPRFTWTVPQIG